MWRGLKDRERLQGRTPGDSTETISRIFTSDKIDGTANILTDKTSELITFHMYILTSIAWRVILININRRIDPQLCLVSDAASACPGHQLNRIHEHKTFTLFIRMRDRMDLTAEQTVNKSRIMGETPAEIDRIGRSPALKKKT